MATLIFTALGTVIGGPIGGAIGALAGRQADALLFAPAARQGPRLTELNVSTSSYGAPLPRHFGRMRVPGQIIWATDLMENRTKRGSGKGRPAVVDYTYSASFAVALSSRPLLRLGRIWADGKLLRGAQGDLKVGGTVRFHSGHADQPADELIAAAEGAHRCPAWRGTAYVVFQDLQLAEFGNRIPALSFEVIADDGPVNLALMTQSVGADYSADVPLPGLAGLSSENSLADLLSTLDPVFQLGCDACDVRLRLRAEGSAEAVVQLDEAAISPDADDFGAQFGHATTRDPAPRRAGMVLRYYDVGRDYQPGAQQAGGTVGQAGAQVWELPAALLAGDAHALVNAAARRQGWAGQTVVWRCAQLDTRIAPGSVVRLPGKPGLWRVRDWEWRRHGVELTLARTNPGPETRVSVTDAGRFNPPLDALPGATQLAAFEMPWDGVGPSVPTIVVAAAGSGAAWNGAELFSYPGDGTLRPLGFAGREQSIMGVAVDALRPASPYLVDQGAGVVVQLAGPHAALSDATMRQLVDGANRAMLGEEIIQFLHALPLGGGRWRLSGLLRGRGGTEHALASHRPGETFILLDGTGVLFSRETVGVSNRIAAIGLGDTQPVFTAIGGQGIADRPLSPVHGRCTRLADGALVLRWQRRARGAWVWRDQVEVPLNEQSERYEVVLSIAATPRARWELAQPRLTLSGAEATAIGLGASPATFAIRQIGDAAVSLPMCVPVAFP